MYKLIFTFGLILAFVISNAQIKPILSCQGNIPPEILGMANAKYKKDIEKIKNEKNRKVKKDFYLVSNFAIDELLKSGKILFGDEVSTYVNQVAQEVLKSEPELLKKLRFFVVKSSEVNAFSTQQGMIFINLGLLAQLETEAQLAYVIAHEAIHYKYNHVIDQYVNKQDLIRGRGRYGVISDDKRANLFYNRSKEDEFIADKLGLTEIFLKSKYNIEDAANLFDILLYSDLPFDEIEFDTNYFNTSSYKLNTAYILKEIAAITTIENYNDENHTHPNIKKRRESFIETTLDYSNAGKQSFIISKDIFMKVRHLSRLEVLGLYILTEDYSKAFYSAYLLEIKDSTNDYLNYVLNYSMYAVAKSKNLKSSENNYSSYKKKEGKSQQVYYIFSTIKGDELSLIALNKIWKSTKNSSYSEYNKKMAEGLMKDLICNYKISSSEIINQNTVISDSANFKKLTKDEYDALSKYEKIKYDKKLKLVDVSEKKQKNANLLLNELMTDATFSKLYKELEIKYEYLKTSENDDELEENSSKNKKNKESKEKVNSLCVYNPQYERYNYDNIDLIGAEQKGVDFLNSISECAILNNIKIEKMDANAFKNTDIENYNNLFSIAAWTSEIGGQLDNNTFDLDSNIAGIMPFYQPQMDAYIAKSGIKHIMYSSITFSIDHRENVGFTVFYCIVMFPLLPYGLYYAFTPEKSTDITNICVNGSTGGIVMSKNASLNYRDYNSLINSQFYDFFYKLKHGKY